VSDEFDRVQASLANVLERRRLLEGLREDKAFIYLNSLVQQQVDQLQNEILFIPLTSVDSAWIQEYKKGELKGKLSWADALETEIDSLGLTIRKLQDDLNVESDGREGTTDRAP